jgi:hypothetical protein
MLMLISLILNSVGSGASVWEHPFSFGLWSLGTGSLSEEESLGFTARRPGHPRGLSVFRTPV